MSRNVNYLANSSLRSVLFSAFPWYFQDISLDVENSSGSNILNYILSIICSGTTDIQPVNDQSNLRTFQNGSGTLPEVNISNKKYTEYNKSLLFNTLIINFHRRDNWNQRSSNNKEICPNNPLVKLQFRWRCEMELIFKTHSLSWERARRSLYIISVKRGHEMGMHLFGKEGKLLGEKVLKELCAT